MAKQRTWYAIYGPAGDYFYTVPPEASIIDHDERKEPVEPTLSDLVTYWQNDLEGENYHGQIEVVSRLRDVLLRHVNEETALTVMFDLFEMGALYG